MPAPLAIWYLQAPQPLTGTVNNQPEALLKEMVASRSKSYRFRGATLEMFRPAVYYIGDITLEKAELDHPSKKDQEPAQLNKQLNYSVTLNRGGFSQYIVQNKLPHTRVYDMTKAWHDIAIGNLCAYLKFADTVSYHASKNK